MSAVGALVASDAPELTTSAATTSEASMITASLTTAVPTDRRPGCEQRPGCWQHAIADRAASGVGFLECGPSGHCAGVVAVSAIGSAAVLKHLPRFRSLDRRLPREFFLRLSRDHLRWCSAGQGMKQPLRGLPRTWPGWNRPQAARITQTRITRGTSRSGPWRPSSPNMGDDASISLIPETGLSC